MQVRNTSYDCCRINILLVLKRLMNKLKPGSVPKIHTQGSPMKLRENIGLFQTAARAYGVSESEVFQAVDCFDKQNIQQVTVSLYFEKYIIQTFDDF